MGSLLEEAIMLFLLSFSVGAWSSLFLKSLSPLESNKTSSDKVATSDLCDILFIALCIT